MKQIERLENEIKALEKTPCYSRDYKKIEALRAEIRRLEDEMIKNLEEW